MSSNPPSRPQPQKGRGTVSLPDGRYNAHRREAFDDGWAEPEEISPATVLTPDAARTVIAWNESPDIAFDRSVNPYRGCEHGCVYCYARPSHAYLGLSPGLDFETKISFKEGAAARLTEELGKPSYRCAPLALGVNTDAWQPVERRLGMARELLRVLSDWNHPVYLVTKSALVERDADILADMARRRLVQVEVSLSSLDPELARRLEPRAASPARRLRVIETLASAGIPVGLSLGPVIPALTDHEIEAILEAAAARGVGWAKYLLLRLPLELRDIFKTWLADHAPGRAGHVMSLIRQLRDGRENDTAFGRRMTGSGPLADIYRQRFRVAAKRLGLEGVPPVLDCTAFRRPPAAGDQLGLF